MDTLKIQSTNFKLELGQIDKNYEKIIDTIKKANDKSIDIVSFPELSLTGSTLKNYFHNKLIVEKSLRYIIKLIEESEKYNILFTVGSIIKVKDDYYNSVFAICNGEIKSVYIKENLKLTEKNIFKSYDYSFDQIKLNDEILNIKNGECFKFKGSNLAITIGEDEEKTIPNSLIYKNKGAKIILHPENMYFFTLDQRKKIEEYKYLSKDILYISTSSGIGESSTDFVFTGLNIILDDGKVVSKTNNASCEYNFLLEYSDVENENIYQLELDRFPYLPQSNLKHEFAKETIEIQAKGLIRRLEHIGIKDVVLGLSGGLDSTMALMAIIKAYDYMNLSYDHIHLYTLPAFATSKRTKSNAYKLAEALSLKLEEIDITNTVKNHLSDIGHDFRKDSAYENAQARERTQVLMDIANMKNAIVIGTGDLSELALGFATYNGDQMSMYSLNASITKTEIRYILNDIKDNTKNKKLQDVLKDILDTPISPELVNSNDNSITQKTEDIVGPYELIDYFIFEMIHNGYDKKIIAKKAKIAFKNQYTSEVIDKWLDSFIKRFFNNQFKRSCSPDGVATKKMNFSPREGYVIPSDIKSDFFNKD